MAKIMTKIEFNKFLDEIYVKVMDSPRYDFFRVGNKIVVFNIYSNKSGIARSYDDVFNTKYGVALAYCRMKGIEFPKVKTVQRVSISTLKSGDVFNYLGDTYTFLAKHPNKKDSYFVLKRNDEVVRLYSATVSIETVE